MWKGNNEQCVFQKEEKPNVKGHVGIWKCKVSLFGE